MNTDRILNGNGSRRFMLAVLGIQSTVLLSLGGIIYNGLVKQIDALRTAQENSLASQTAAKLEERTSMWVPIIQKSQAGIQVLDERLTRLEAQVEINQRNIDLNRERISRK